MANIASNTNAINGNFGLIQDNASEINSLGNAVDILRSGVAATLATAGMPVPPGQGWGYGVGTGHFDGESAIALGLSYRDDATTFKFTVGNSGGEATVSAGFARNF